MAFSGLFNLSNRLEPRAGFNVLAVKFDSTTLVQRLDCLSRPGGLVGWDSHNGCFKRNHTIDVKDVPALAIFVVRFLRISNNHAN